MGRKHGEPRAGRAPRTRSASSATTCTAAPTPGSRPLPATGSHSRPGRATRLGARERHVLLQGHGRGRRGKHGRRSNEATADRRRRTAPSARASRRPSAGSTVNVSWTAATDNLGVARYNVHRGDSSGFTPSLGQPDRPADRFAYADPGLAGDVLLQGHGRGRGRERRAGLEHGAATVARHHCSRRAGQARPRSAARARRPQLGRLERQRRRHSLQRAPVHDLGLYARRRQPGRAAHRNEPHGYRTCGRHVLLPGHRRGRRRKRRSRLGEASAIVTAHPPRPRRRVRLRSGSGTSATDQSGAGNTGTLGNTTWTTAGKYGKALSFDGINDLVTVPSRPASTSPPA